MDLTRMQTWTRQTLEREAEKLGISRPELRSRAELIGLIMRHHYAALASVQDARKLVGSVVQSAVSVLPDPFGTLSRWRTRLQLPGSREARLGQPDRGEARVIRQPAATQRTFEKPRSSDEPWQQTTPPPPTAASTKPAVVDPIPPAPKGPSEDLPPALASAPKAETRSFVEEPIRTRSMARLLATQGHRERALAIYEELMAKDSSEPSLVQEAEALRKSAASLFPAGELPKPPEHLRQQVPESTDHLECVSGAQGRLCLRWQITDEGRARARTLLGSDGELAVRVVTIRPDAERIVRSEITEHGPIALSGEWTAQLDDPGARRFAAVGLRDERHFVSIVHMQT